MLCTTSLVAARCTRTEDPHYDIILRGSSCSHRRYTVPLYELLQHSSHYEYEPTRLPLQFLLPRASTSFSGARSPGKSRNSSSPGPPPVSRAPARPARAGGHLRRDAGGLDAERTGHVQSGRGRGDHLRYIGGGRRDARHHTDVQQNPHLRQQTGTDDCGAGAEPTRLPLQFLLPRASTSFSGARSPGKSRWSSTPRRRWIGC